MPARRGARRPRYGVSRAHRDGGHLGYGSAVSRGHGHLRRSARQASRIRAARQARHLPGPDLLDAQHQYISRSALGARDGDLRRGSVSHRAHGRRVCTRPGGRRSQISENGLDRQALRRTQRTRIDAPRVRRAHFGYGSARHLPAAVPGSRGGGRRILRDVRLQQRGRLAGVREHAPAGRYPARRVALPRLRGFRLRRGGRYLAGAQSGQDRRWREWRWP